MRWVSNITYTAQKNGFARTERSSTALEIVTESTQGLSMLCSGAMDEECGLRRRREKEMFWVDDAPRFLDISLLVPRITRWHL